MRILIRFILFKNLFFLKFYIKKVHLFCTENPSKTDDLLYLLNTVFSSALADLNAVSILIHRNYIVQASSILRINLERIASATSLLDDESQLEKIISGEFQSTKALSSLKKYYSTYGYANKYYTDLSNHQTIDTLGVVLMDKIGNRNGIFFTNHKYSSLLKSQIYKLMLDFLVHCILIRGLLRTLSSTHNIGFVGKRTFLDLEIKFFIWRKSKIDIDLENLVARSKRK